MNYRINNILLTYGIVCLQIVIVLSVVLNLDVFIGLYKGLNILFLSYIRFKRSPNVRKSYKSEIKTLPDGPFYAF